MKNERKLYEVNQPKNAYDETKSIVMETNRRMQNQLISVMPIMSILPIFV